MARIVGIAGSLRRVSYNRGLLRAAQAAAPAGSVIDIADIAAFPVYNGDVEAAGGLPPAVETVKQAIVAADALLIVTPEYNGGIPGVLKNAIDWISRPPADTARVFGGKPIAIVGASPGRLGTAMAQDAWLSVVHALGARLWSGGRLMVSGASGLFDADGNLTDDATRDRLAKFLADFAATLK